MFVQLVLLQVAGVAMLFQFGNELLRIRAVPFCSTCRASSLALLHLAFRAWRASSLLQSFGLVAQLLRLQMRLLGQRALLFGDLAMVFGVGDDVLKAHLIAA